MGVYRRGWLILIRGLEKPSWRREYWSGACGSCCFQLLRIPSPSPLILPLSKTARAGQGKKFKAVRPAWAKAQAEQVQRFLPHAPWTHCINCQMPGVPGLPLFRRFSLSTPPYHYFCENSTIFSKLTLNTTVSLKPFTITDRIHLSGFSLPLSSMCFY